MYYPTLYKLYIFVFGFDKPLEVINKKLRPTNEGNEKLTIDPKSTATFIGREYSAS